MGNCTNGKRPSVNGSCLIDEQCGTGIYCFNITFTNQSANGYFSIDYDSINNQGCYNGK